MSDPTPPPPTPGTQPIVGDDLTPGLPRHREDPERARADRVAGELRHSDQARTSRADAVARDLAAATERGVVGPAPLPVPSLDELASMTDTNLAHDLRDHMQERAGAVAAAAAGRTGVDEAERRTEESRGAHGETLSQRPPEPATGRRFTHYLIPILVLPVLIYLETKLSAPSVRAALETNDRAADGIAVGLAALMTVSAELVGLAGGAFVGNRGRLARCALAALAFATAACLTWGVVDLGSAREHNKAYADSHKPASTSTTAGRGFGAAAPGGATRRPSRAGFGTDGGFGAAPASPGPPTTPGFGRRSGGDAPSAPDLGFAVPITLAALLAAAALAMRCTVAHGEQRWENRLKQAADRLRADEDELERARQRLADVSGRLDASDLYVAAAAEREAATLTGLLGRFAAEYERACFARSVRPLQLELPQAPDPQALALRLLDPERATATQPVVVPTVVEGPLTPPGDEDRGLEPAEGSGPGPENEGHPVEPPAPEPTSPVTVDMDATADLARHPHTEPTDAHARTRELFVPAGWSWLETGTGVRHNGHGNPDDISRIRRPPDWE